MIFKLNLHIITRILSKSSYLTLVVSFLAIISTNAFLSDNEISIGNTFASATLDLEVSAKTTSFDVQNLLPGQSSSKQFIIKNNGNLPFIYNQTIANLSTTDGLCQELDLKVYYYWYDASDVLHKELKSNKKLSAYFLNAMADDDDAQIPNSHPYQSNADYLANENWYVFEASLPTDADPSLGNQTCSFDLITKARQIGGSYGSSFWDEESNNNSLTSDSWAKISGIKFHDLNQNGIKDTGEEGLADWTIFAGKEFDQLTLDTTVDNPVTSQNLVDGTKYIIKVSGTYQANNEITADVKYTNKSGSSDWTDTVPDFEANGPTFLDLQIDGSSPDWGSYQSDHEYWLAIIGDGNPLTFSLNDVDFSNNLGSLEIIIFESVVSDITNDEGEYEIDLTELNGQFIVGEELISGWMQTAPAKGFYTFTSAALYENKDFDNIEVPPAEDIVKVVINEVYQDATNSQEWIELYNSGTKATGLGGWTIADGAGIDTLGDYTLGSTQFAVIVTNGADTALLSQIASNNPAAVIIALTDATIGAGLNGTGDRLILKKADNTEMDKVSWGDDNSIFVMANMPSLQSYKRSTAGLDTDSASDWVINLTPDPGTNPHSHIQVNLNQDQQKLLLSFSNASGFDLVKYLITYSHLYNGIYIQEAITGEKSKLLYDTLLLLNPFYFGTCSSLGQVCVSHYGIKDINIALEYFNGDNTLGTSEIKYSWRN